MPTYTITRVETVTYRFDLDAETPEEARAIADTLDYGQGEIIATNSEIVSCEEK